MDFISDESICAAFEDLIVNFDAEDVPSIRYTERDVESVDVHFVPKQNAFAMSLTDLMPELERRSLPVKGFFSDDAKTLQVAFDREHDSYVEAKKKELFDSQVIEAQAAAVSRKETLIKESIAAEESEVVGSARIMAWFQMIQDKVSPVHCRIEELTDVSARSLSKLLWSDSNLVSLDVSNMSLSDDSGAFLARALRKNTCLKKLDLGGNQFGSKCCLQLAKSLLANPSSALAFLSLESNPLCTGNDSKESIGLLVNAIGKNTSLVSLSLWRCGLGIEAGMMLAQEIERGNSRLISLEVGYNHFNSLDVVRISEKLVSQNTKYYESFHTPSSHVIDGT